MTYWAVYATATGELLGVVCCVTHPRFNGYDWDGASMTATNLGDAAPDLAVKMWDTGTKAFVDDLGSLKDRKAEAVNELRLVAETSGCSTPSGIVDSDERSRGLISGAALMAFIAKTTGQSFEESWTMHDNSQVTLDADGMIGVGTAVGLYISAVHARGVELKAAIEAAAGVNELDAIDITTGWPS